MQTQVPCPRHASPWSIALAALAAATVISTAGCGGGGGGGSTSSSTPASLPAAESGLNSLVFQSSTPTSSQISSVAANFKSAYQAAPTNADAAMGYAISESALDAQTYATKYGLLESSANDLPAGRAKANVKAQSLRLSSLGNLLILWKLPTVLSQGSSISLELADFVPLTPLHAEALKANDQTETPAEIQADLAAIDADLVTVETALAIPISQSGFTYTLTNPSNGSQSYKIGVPELQTLLTAVELVRSVLNVSLIYSADDSNYPAANSLAETVFSAQLATAGTQVEPTAFGPGTPFLSLESDGKVRSGNVASEISNAGTNITDAINGIEGRNNSGYLLNPGTFVTTSQLNTVKSDIQQYKSYLTSTETNTFEFDGQSITATIDLGGFLANPPASLYSILPVLTTGPDPYEQSTNEFYVGSSGFPDPTLGGLFPSGLPLSSFASNGSDASYTLPADSTVTVEDVASYDVDYFEGAI